MVIRSSPFLMVFFALQAIPAYGQEQDPREIQAQKDCLTGKADAGVALLAELYALTGNANFIYNQARCYEQAARPDEAINRFREYLRVAKNLTPEDRADVDKHLQECRVLQAEKERERERRAAAEAAAAAAAPPAPSAAPAQPAPGLPGYAPMPVYAPAPGFAPSSAEAANPLASPAAGLDQNAQPKAAESTPIYATWWFWTGMAAVVAGGVTAFFLTTRRTTENACSGATIPCDAIK